MHSHSVQLIRNSGDAICLKVCTPPRRAPPRPVRLPDSVAVSWQQEPRLSTASYSAGRSKDRPQRASKTSSTVARHNHGSPSQTAVEHPASAQLAPRLSTARSMPDLTAASADNHNTSDHTSRRKNNDATGQVNQRGHGSSDRDRVLYELTNQLRPLPAVPPSQHGESSLAQNDRTASESNRPASADQLSGAQRRPTPPPRGTSLSSSRSHSSTYVGSQITAASRAKSAGSELKQLLAVSCHAATSSSPTAGHQQEIFSSSPSTTARSTVSGEHLILPSHLKKLQPTSPNDHAAKKTKADDSSKTNGTSTSDGAHKINGSSSSSSAVQQHSIVEYRSPATKRLAPPPPSISQAANGEVNFLVMAEQARKQYLSKLARGTPRAGKSGDPSANEPQRTLAQQPNDNGLLKPANGSTSSIETNGVSHFTANGKIPEHLHSSNDVHNRTTSPLQDSAKGLNASETVELGDSGFNSPQELPPDLRSAQQPSGSSETPSPIGPPPAMPPKRRSRNNSLVALCNNNETSYVERHMTSNIYENVADEMLHPHEPTSERSAAKVSDNSVVNITQELAHPQNSNEHGRKSNAKLIRGKNVAIRRSGVTQLPVYDNLPTNDEHPPTNGHTSCDDDSENIQQLIALCDIGVLPPPPDFAD